MSIFDGYYASNKDISTVCSHCMIINKCTDTSEVEHAHRYLMGNNNHAIFDGYYASNTNCLQSLCIMKNGTDTSDVD